MLSIKTANASTKPTTLRRVAITVGVVIASAVGWRLAIFDPTMMWGGDNAMYMMLARNLLEGHAYADTGYAQSALAYLAPASYPPGFPIALAPALAMFGLNITAIKLYMIGLYGVAIAMCAWLAATRLPADRTTSYWVIVGVAALVAWNPRFAGWATLILSESVFVIVTYGALIACDHAYRRLDSHRSCNALFTLAGGLILASLATRVFGLALILAVWGYELVRYRRPTRFGVMLFVIAGLAGAVLLGPRLLGTSTGETSYLTLVFQDLFAHLNELPVTVSENLGHYGRLLRHYWLIVPGSATNQLVAAQWIAWLSLPVVAIGLWNRWRSSPSVIEIFALVYLASLLPWHSYGSRYLIPLMALYVVYLTAGLLRIERVLSAPRHAVLWLACCLAIFGYGLTYRATADFDHRIAPAAPNGPNATAMYRYIKQTTPKDTRILVRDPRTLALFTRRGALTYTDNANDQSLPGFTRVVSYAREMGVDYVLATPSDPGFALLRWVNLYPNAFSFIYAEGPFRLYRLRKAN